MNGVSTAISRCQGVSPPTENEPSAIWPPASLNDQLEGPVHGFPSGVGVHAALVAIGRIGAEPQFAGSGTDGLGAEDRALDHQIGRVVADARSFRRP